MRKLFVFVLMIISFFLEAQSTITLEDIWLKGTFRTKTVPGFNFLNDGANYVILENGIINSYSIETGLKREAIFDSKGYNELKDFGSYSLSSDENKIHIETAVEPIYRYSYASVNYVYDRVKNTLQPINNKKPIMYGHFDGKGSKIGFVYQNDLYFQILLNSKIIRVTKDGKKEEIINGASDWVYEEEFTLTRAFEWNNNDSKLAYLRFDERKVPNFKLDFYKDDAYPDVKSYKYPKVGENNSILDLFIYDVKTSRTIKVNLGSDKDFYIPRIKWTKDPNVLSFIRLNRNQNLLQLVLVDARTGLMKVIMEEKNRYYIDIHDNLVFLDNGKEFLWTSESLGFNHVFLYNLSGQMVSQLTKGDFEVTQLYGLDQKNQILYYQSTQNGPTNRVNIRKDLKSGIEEKLNEEQGDNNAQFSKTFEWYVNTFSTINAPPRYDVFNQKGEKVRTIEDNIKLKNLQTQYKCQNVEFLTFANRNKETLNGWMIKPPGFSEEKNHPVLMYLYGGPGSQQVIDNWHGANYWWFQLLAQKGYLIVCVDNRGTGGRGEAFKKQTYMQLGNLETMDQMDVAKYLGGLPYVDKKRIGIFGWSYGGYMSSLCLLKGNDVFKSAIAVAPVTNWKWYDSVYTERYMRTEKENETGYRENSPVYFADRLKGNYLLVHGLTDDNVHFQNTAEMANALIKENKQFETYFYPNRNHGIAGGVTRLHLFTKMTNFVLEKI